jgi:hypothetical protein
VAEVDKSKVRQSVESDEKWFERGAVKVAPSETETPARVVNVGVDGVGDNVKLVTQIIAAEIESLTNA